METILIFLAGLFMSATGLVMIVSSKREKKLRKNLKDAHERLYDLERENISKSIDAKPLDELLNDDEFIIESSKEPNKD